MPKKKKPAAKKASKKVEVIEDEEEEDDDEEEEEAPKKTKKGKGKKEASKKKSKSGSWDELLESLASGGGNGSVWFPKAGKTKIKLALEDAEDDQSFFIPVSRDFRGNGQFRDKYLLRGVVLDQEEDKMSAVQVSKTAFKQVIQLLAEGYELFDPEEGHGLVITKTGEGKNTSWAVMPSPRPIETPEVDDPEWTLEELPDQMDKIDEASDKGKGKDGKKKKSKDDDDDEEDDW